MIIDIHTRTYKQSIAIYNYHNSKNYSFPFSDGITVAKRKLKVMLEALHTIFPSLVNARVLIHLFCEISASRYPFLFFVGLFHYRSTGFARVLDFDWHFHRIILYCSKMRAAIRDTRVERKSNDGDDNSSQWWMDEDKENSHGYGIKTASATNGWTNGRIDGKKKTVVERKNERERWLVMAGDDDGPWLYILVKPFSTSPASVTNKPRPFGLSQSTILLQA